MYNFAHLTADIDLLMADRELTVSVGA